MLSASGWDTQDLSTCGIASTFLGSAYDGSRYVYMLPGTGNPAKSVVVRMDTMNFNSCMMGYRSFDMTTLTASGPGPNYIGNGLPSDMKGTGGGVAVLDPSGNLWLYVIPWNLMRTPTTEVVGYTVARVQIGYSGTPINPFASTAVRRARRDFRARLHTPAPVQHPGRAPAGGSLPRRWE